MYSGSCFDVAITNGLMLMKESANHNRVTKNNRQKPHTMLEFRMNLAKLLIGDYKENKRAALETISNGYMYISMYLQKLFILMDVCLKLHACHNTGTSVGLLLPYS